MLKTKIRTIEGKTGKEIVMAGCYKDESDHIIEVICVYHDFKFKGKITPAIKRDMEEAIAKELKSKNKSMNDLINA